jgi:uncharacterized protein (TIGR02757 family)
LPKENVPFRELKDFLDQKADAYNNPGFIETDPISIPHLFSKKEDIEIVGFLAATLAWGQRVTILKNARQLALWMDDAPYDFITGFTKEDLKPFRKFVHRTFNGEDAVYFLKALQHIYLEHKGLEAVFARGLQGKDAGLQEAISSFRTIFFGPEHPARTAKHVSDPMRNSSAKRICMYLRWMVRNDKRGVDFGIWKSIPPAELHAPLDLHSGATARKLGLLTRKQDDWKAVAELTANLRLLDPDDPVKYDFALYGLGVFEKFNAE